MNATCLCDRIFPDPDKLLAETRCPMHPERGTSHDWKSRRPEWVKCISHTHANDSVPIRGVWCGSKAGPLEFCFVNLDHAAYNGRSKGRLVACPECVDAAMKCLREGQ